MKTLQSSLLLLALLCTIFSTQSCKNECDDLICENGGICVDGTCDCPDGFSGANCQIQNQTQNPCSGIICFYGGICVDGTCDCPDGYIGVNCESFDPNQIQTLLNIGWSPIDLYNGGISLEQLYGKVYEGGLLFYLNTNDGSGMVSATVDQSSEVDWGCVSTDIPDLINVTNSPDGPGSNIGDGEANTDAILSGCATNGIPARLCRALGEDWFLPSIQELELMNTNLHANGHGGFSTGYFTWYWSSSEESAAGAWYHDFNSNAVPSTSARNKGFSAHVRAARAF